MFAKTGERRWFFLPFCMHSRLKYCERTHVMKIKKKKKSDRQFNFDESWEHCVLGDVTVLASVILFRPYVYYYLFFLQNILSAMRNNVNQRGFMDVFLQPLSLILIFCMITRLVIFLGSCLLEVGPGLFSNPHPKKNWKKKEKKNIFIINLQC